MADEEQPLLPPGHDFSVLETMKKTWYLGFVSYGGTVATLGIMRSHFVLTGDPSMDRDRWVDDRTFLELQALSSALPGPTTTQLLCAIAMLRGGWIAGVLSFICWNLPAAFLVTAVGSHIGEWLHGGTPPWLAGAKAAASALVFLAAFNFVKSTCLDKQGNYILSSCALVTLSTCAVLICNDADVQAANPYLTMWVYPLLLVFGGLVTLLTVRGLGQHGVGEKTADRAQLAVSDRIARMSVPTWVGGLVCAVTLGLLGLCFYWAPSHADRADCDADCRGWNIFNAFWRMGATIYGGGQVVVPMTLNYVVGPGWVTTDQFYQGLALIGMMPGPMFNFSAYIGAVYGAAMPGGSFVASLYCTVMAWCGLFGPGLLLIFGIVPFWAVARRSETFQALLPGVCATAVGLIVGSCATLFEQTVVNPACAITFTFTVCAQTFMPWPASLKNYRGPMAIVIGAAVGAVMSTFHVGTALYASQYVCHSTGVITNGTGADGEYHYCPDS
eukprot:TRINITY_DN969_c0_g1_i1.p1 TRINITY_DN969_c0_g1~~TRINITY_DN969_c0_g1_i1.p1  ORF type:complete len:500 (+),score=147.98 TRINITY_DN969_c0_g1_i1:70-1569(+)